VLGVDVSERMLERARSMTQDDAITYARGDLEELDLPEASFDLAYSSLVFHYVVKLRGLFATIRRSLLPGGQLVFSIEHPIFMAPRRPGWITDAEGRKSWPVDDYSVEGPRTTNWLVEGVVKQHRTLGTTLNALSDAGFTIARVEEWGPTDEQIAELPELAAERERPPFLIVGARN
jgi:ubiquinone/menaquinone biosynthesis C-methylase UbiE